MIVKIQKPMISDEDVPMSLLYNRDRTVMIMIPFADVAELFGTYQMKVYVRAQLEGKNLILEDIVSNQDF